MKFKKVFLKDISIKNRGVYGIGASAVDFNEKLPKYLRITDINDDGSINFLELKSVDDKNYQKYILKENDIVFARTGNSTGKNYFYNPADGELVYAGFLIKFSLNPEKVFPEYVKYYCMSSEYWGWVGGFSSGSTRKNINAKIYGELPLFLPSVENQKKIVNILNPLLKRIDINKKIIITLEEIVETLFNHWFIDFEFPDKNGNPYKSSGGKMIESELGKIPEGWVVKKLCEVCEVKDGTHDSPKKVEKGYPLVTSKHLESNRIDFSKANEISYDDFEKINKRSKVNTGDILISMIGTVGKVYYVNDTNINFAIKNIGLIKSSQRNDIGIFIYLQINSDYIKRYVEMNLAGSTQKYISLGKLREIPFLLPKSDTLMDFCEIANTINNKISMCVEENNSLKELRDTLLPKLLSGEIELE